MPMRWMAMLLGWIVMVMAVAGCDLGEEVDEDADVPPATDAGPEAGTPEYRFVLIEDRSGTSDTGEHPGADIDAVAIVRETGAIYAAAVESAGPEAVNVDGALGEANEPIQCFVGEFASLGGTGGYMILGGFGTTIRSGDELHILEVGAAACGPSGTDAASVAVSISTTSDRAGTWAPIGTCTSFPCVQRVP